MNKVSILTALFIVAFIIASMVGYVFNIVKLTKCDFEPNYNAEVCRAIGVFVPPAGAIMGYVTIKDGVIAK